MEYNQRLGIKYQVKFYPSLLKTLQDTRLQLLQFLAERLPDMASSFIVQGNGRIRLDGTRPHIQPMCLHPCRRSLDHQARTFLGGASRNVLEDFEDYPADAP